MKSSRSIQIEAPPEFCYDIIWDFGSYPEFVEESKKVNIISLTEHEAIVEFTIHVLKDLVYSLRLVGNRPHEIRWSLHQGFFKKNDGCWLLTETENGQTLAVYEFDLEFGLPVPSSLVTMLEAINFLKMLEAFKKRIESKRRTLGPLTDQSLTG